jgi:hypothetical protein
VSSWIAPRDLAVIALQYKVIAVSSQEQLVDVFGGPLYLINAGLCDTK